ncbi:4'-phosphopantetheinyl transferase [Corynebacterium sp. sy039]|uniref:4'-phosphopantetheinyl transferase family protein n=1 Tax=Corynebacterium sp. sy039 TaxID=2599641 RepID=UPI0011B5BE24|nr:4'-phosphopantetheinyl transferase superfamily protein [Corynebacterium sp. sy039]QDZ42793.1 4'-phosphopantetheinyl transferase superfamily protein [Corynebacterium sp. sy039]
MLDPRLFPECARAYSLRVDPQQHDLSRFNQLHPLEQVLVSHAVAKRKAEFGDARWCAHQALAQLHGDTGEPILRGERGMPLFPSSVSGSLSHTAGFRAAVVAPRLIVPAMGIDIEQAEPLPEGVFEAIAHGSEKTQIAQLMDSGIYCADRLLFCAKEATYKAWFPLSRRWLGFDEAEIKLYADGTFSSCILTKPTPVPVIEGKWLIEDGYIVSTTAVLSC